MNGPAASVPAVGTPPQTPALTPNGGALARRPHAFAAPGPRSADCQSAGSQVANLRRLSRPRACWFLRADADWKSAIQQIGNRRYDCGRLALLVLLLSSPSFQLPTAHAQSYSVPWHTIDGGGGTSTGGVYRVTGTIGQPDAGGPLTNGQYSVTGGFWALPTAVQTPGAPTLTITPATPGFATISWTPATGTNWILQERLSLTAGAWTNSPSGWTNPITVPTTLPAKFYRLFKP
jgi:hypothetical protein